jgi:dephospho-CoA kinase
MKHMNDKKVITLVGMPGAGKSYCVEYLQKKGLPSVYFGGITIDEVKRRGLEVNEANEKMVREDIRAQEGIGGYAKRIVPQIEQYFADGHPTVVADGLYGWTEYKIFKERFGERAIIIAITAPRHIRHERLAKRPVRPLTDEEATAREYAEIENIEKGGPIANADYTILNNTTPDDMLAQLDKVLAEAGILAE